MENNQIQDINRIVFDILKQSKSLHIFPTPVDQIIEFTELRIDSKVDLNEIPSNYLSQSTEKLKKVLRDVRGVLDRREKIIYIDPNQSEPRKNFVKLHEVGHDILPWQRKFYEYIQDDDDTIDTHQNEEFEFEANYFASSTLFQLDRFDEEAQKLPLEIKSPMYLAKFFGSSQHAALRRYVLGSKKRCALLVLKDIAQSSVAIGCAVRNYFQSDGFTKAFGEIIWETEIGVKWQFVQDYLRKRRFHTDGVCCLFTKDGPLTFQYHYFFNTFNAFVFIFPLGEKNVSRTKIYVRT